MSTWGRWPHTHDQLGRAGQKTGFWLEEFAAPYYVFKDAGTDITLASPKGGQPPIDPLSDVPEAQTESTQRFKKDKPAQLALANTNKLSTIVADDFDGVFYPGGHGPLWDLADDNDSIALIESAFCSGKPIAFVCHAPAALLQTKAEDGGPLVRGKSVTGFANSEETARGLTEVVPFLIEEMLKKNGGNYSKALDGSSYVVSDANLITGQNPSSSKAAATVLLERLNTINHLKHARLKKAEGNVRAAGLEPSTPNRGEYT